MSRYILNNNKQDSLSGENYEIHNVDNCTHLPLLENRLFVGYFNNCKDALLVAKNQYPKHKEEIDGCFWCCNSCHKK